MCEIRILKCVRFALRKVEWEDEDSVQMFMCTNWLLYFWRLAAECINLKKSVLVSISRQEGCISINLLTHTSHHLMLQYDKHGAASEKLSRLSVITCRPKKGYTEPRSHAAVTASHYTYLLLFIIMSNESSVSWKCIFYLALAFSAYKST